MGSEITYYHNYSPVGDLTVLAICFVFIILIRSSFISRTKNFLIFCGMIGLLMLSALTGVLFNVGMTRLGEWSGGVVCVLRILQHFTLFGTLFLYVCYVMEPLHLDRRWDKRFVILAGIGYVFITVHEIVSTVSKTGFYIEDGKVHEGFNIFPFGYLFFMGMITFLLIYYRNRMFKQVSYGILGTFFISFLILFVQGRHHQTSFTTVTFLFPISALLYMIHANPYDLEIGAVDETSFTNLISYSYQHGQMYYLMSLFMHDFEGVGK